jgi:hypothetical protein
MLASQAVSGLRAASILVISSFAVLGHFVTTLGILHGVSAKKLYV